MNGQWLKLLHALVRRLGVPFVAAGDWNLSPSELNATQWPQSLQAETVAPENVEFTCTMGQMRIIDFLVVSKVMRPLVTRVLGDLSFKWSPHVGVSFQLSMRPRSLHVKKLVKPLPLFEGARASTHCMPKRMSWSCAWQQAQLVVPKIVVRDLGIGDGYLQEAHSISEHYVRWSRAAELELGAVCSPSSHALVHRGCEPTFVTTPALPRQPPLRGVASQPSEANSAPSFGLWLAVSARLADLEKLRSRGKGARHQLALWIFCVLNLG